MCILLFIIDKTTDVCINNHESIENEQSHALSTPCERLHIDEYDEYYAKCLLVIPHKLISSSQRLISGKMIGSVYCKKKLYYLIKNSAKKKRKGDLIYRAVIS